MPADLEPLLSLLNMQMNINRQLLVLAKEQQQSIINNETDKLDDAVRRQFGELKQLTILEKKRLAAVTAIQADLGIPSKALTLNELIPYAQPYQQILLQNLLGEFTDLLNELKEINNTNKLLLQTGIELNDLMLSLLTDNVDPLNNLYCGDGSEAKEGPVEPSLFDHQI
ncbi:MAG: flagellar protein FlgN [Firmicutes bacterium]|nr:flagellar protein FlgN [Bacillota bacterium]